MVDASDCEDTDPRERSEAQGGSCLGEAPTADAVGISREAGPPGTTGLRQWLEFLFYIHGAGETSAPQPEAVTAGIVVQALPILRVFVSERLYLRCAFVCGQSPWSLSEASEGQVPAVHAGQVLSTCDRPLLRDEGITIGYSQWQVR